jgi:uncharacterized membrane protein
MASTPPATDRGGGRPTERLQGFSDGVFAVAITLLVLNLHDPGSPLGHGLIRMWPHYATYVVSFLTIGIIWMNHHVQYERVVRSDRTLMVLNLVLLMTVTVIPFPTGLLATYLQGGTDEQVAAAVYAGTLLVMGLAFLATNLWAAHRRLFADWLVGQHTGYVIWRNSAGLLVYVLAVGIAFVSPAVSLLLCGLVALYYLLPGRTLRDTTPP